MCDGLIAFPTLTLIITTMTVIQRQIKCGKANNRQKQTVFSPYDSSLHPDNDEDISTQSKKLLLLSVYSDYSTDSIATTNVGAGELRSDPLIPVTLTPSR
ncbi:unnamed protein product [Brassica oleracea]